MVTERVAIWDFFNVKDCDFCLKLCRILNKLKKITHFCSTRLISMMSKI